MKSRQSESRWRFRLRHAVREREGLADGVIRARRNHPARWLEARDHPRGRTVAWVRDDAHGTVSSARSVPAVSGPRRSAARPAFVSSRLTVSSRWLLRLVNAAILASIATASSGYLPIADSAESMTQSVPSRMALATSVASARVGRRLAVMESSICVAVMTGLPARFAFAMSCFCSVAIYSIGTSTPRSPRATMMPSAACRISSMWFNASERSIFAMMNGRLPSAAAAARTASMSPRARRTTGSPRPRRALARIQGTRGRVR